MCNAKVFKSVRGGDEEDDGEEREPFRGPCKSFEEAFEGPFTGYLKAFKGTENSK